MHISKNKFLLCFGVLTTGLFFCVFLILEVGTQEQNGSDKTADSGREDCLI